MKNNLIIGEFYKWREGKTIIQYLGKDVDDDGSWRGLVIMCDPDLLKIGETIDMIQIEDNWILLKEKEDEI